MDIFYKDKINIGALSVFTLPEVRGQANLLVFHAPSPSGRTLLPGVVITHVDYQQRTNAQFQRSLGKTIYVYSFGDHMGDLNIRGVAFARTCDGDFNGISELQKMYTQYKVSGSSPEVRLAFADEVIRGFLVAMSVGTADTSAGIHQFSMLLKTIPAVDS